MECLRKLSALTILYLCCDLPVYADNFRGWYAGAGLGQSRLQPETAGTGFSVADKQDIATQILLGYRFHSHFQTELFYADLGVAEISPSGEIDYRLPGAAILYNWPADNAQDNTWRLLLKTGIAGLNNKSDVPYKRENAVQALTSIGVEYRLSRHWSIRTEYERFSEDAQLLSVNMIWTFDRQHVKPVEVFSAPVVEKPLDQDYDGITNGQDKCPNTPLNVSVNAEGCALFQGYLSNIQFETNSSILTLAAKQSLQNIAEALREYPNVLLEVQAHTDSHGKSEYNLSLSEMRAKSVVAYLIELKIDTKQLRPVGYGETQPIDRNDTALGRANNRRVELEVISVEVANE